MAIAHSALVPAEALANVGVNQNQNLANQFTADDRQLERRRE